MSRSLGFAFFLIALSTSVQATFACTCIPPTVKEARDRADAVFLATIKSVTYLEPGSPGSRVTVEFEATRVWKGPVTKQFEMRGIVETSFCEGFFKDDLVVGKQLLVFANRVLDGLKYSYSTNICTLTGPPERFGKTLEVLGEGRTPAK
jgi:hypothetical protein